ncbi:MAG TPA: hypothetical protein VFB62_28800 [Polyangiaceae bacterium]|nr:hypothetical protein [Polyangiaceae bacterium]
MQCGFARVWRVIPFRIPGVQASFGAPTLPVATVHAVDETSIPKRFTASCFELRICDSCGYTAWYTRGLDALRTLASRLAAQGRDDIALLEAPPEQVRTKQR